MAGGRRLVQQGERHVVIAGKGLLLRRMEMIEGHNRSDDLVGVCGRGPLRMPERAPAGGFRRSLPPVSTAIGVRLSAFAGGPGPGECAPDEPTSAVSSGGAANGSASPTGKAIGD